MLGAGYLGSALADLALRDGREVVLADNWYATAREQLAALEERGARVETADIRSRDDIARLLALRPSRIVLLAAQASRPLSERDPDYTEETNLRGVRRVAEAVAAAGGPAVVFGSSLHVYGPGLEGEIGPEQPYGPQGDLAHLSKVYGELVLALHARRSGFGLALMRLGIVYGPSPVEHDAPESVTVVDKFRRLAAAGEPLPLDDGGNAAIGLVHVEDASRILLAAEPVGVEAENVAAETLTVADVAALAEGREASGNAGLSFTTPFAYRRSRGGVPGGAVKLLVTGATGFIGSRVAELLEQRGHEIIRLARPGGRKRAGVDLSRFVLADAGDPAARDLIEGCAGVLHFAGVPDPAGASADPARAVRENAGTTLNLLEGCRIHRAGLVYPSTTRATVDPLPDVYAISKRLGEEACRLHSARSTIVRLTSVYGPGQVAWEGATGAVASFAAAALDGRAITIPGDPQRGRDFVYVDDLVPPLERIAADGLWNDTITVARGESTPLVRAAEAVVAAVGSDTRIETPGGELAAGENETYEADPPPPRLAFAPRPLEEGIRLYVDWLRRHPAAQGRAEA